MLDSDRLEPDDLCRLSAMALAALIRSGDVSPVEVVDAVLRRIDRFNPALNAYCLVQDESAREQAREAEAAIARGDVVGPLHGVPVSIKDNILQAGVRQSSGSRLLRNNVATEDAPAVERIKRAGAVIVGRTNMPEFAWAGSTNNRLYGETRNPWNLGRTPGGSSGGAGAAVAAGLAPIALGTDGAGSIRIPSSFCGIFGLKPSFGRIPFYPSSGPSELSAALGPMTRTVADGALLLDVLAGPDDRDRFSLPAPPGRFVEELGKDLAGLRIAWSPDLGHIPVQAEVARMAESAAFSFSDLGCVVEAPALGLPDPAPILDVSYASIQAGSHGRRPPEQLSDMDPGLVALIDTGRRFSAVEIGQMMVARIAYWQAMRRVFDRYELLLTPTIGVPPFDLGIVGPTAVNGQPVIHLGWTLAYPFNLTGQPAATVPCGHTANGLPIGLQIIGPRFGDAIVIRAAAAFERLRPWADRWPSVLG